MEIVLMIICGLVGGILGGMGMGGGTLLIPLLTIFLGISQKLAQGYNLLSFLIMSLIAIFIHYKNNLIEKRVILPVVIPALIFSCFGASLANFISNSSLRLLFGIFLMILSIFQFIKVFKTK